MSERLKGTAATAAMAAPQLAHRLIRARCSALKQMHLPICSVAVRKWSAKWAYSAQGA